MPKKKAKKTSAHKRLKRGSRDYKQTILELERRLFDFFTLSQLGKSLISLQDMENLARVFASSVYETSNAANVALLVYDTQVKAYTLCCVRNYVVLSFNLP